MTAKASFQNIVIRASAGTGKTYQLAARFIGLLAAGARADEILATTFTRKAAGEILDRVLVWLANAAGDDAQREELREAIGLKTLSAKECRDLLSGTIRQLHCLRVGTLDSYFIQLASSFGYELGLPPGWSICEELIDTALRDEAIELSLASGRMSDLLTLVHSLTKGVATRGVAQLMRGTIAGLFELYCEAPKEAWEHIRCCAGLSQDELEKTLTELASFDLPEGQLTTTRDRDLEKARRGDWDGWLGAGFTAKILAGDATFNRKPLPPEIVALYKQLLRHAESVLVGQVARQTEATHQLLTRFAEHYVSLQLQQRALRFSDVTYRLSVASAAPAIDAAAFRLNGAIRHLLLDEFQDTSPAQWRVLRPLAKNIVAKPGGSFFCVGDAKQAIYGWRGGVAEIFGALDGEIADLASSCLDRSYRSSPPVIDAVNKVFSNLTAHTNLDKLAEPVAKWQAAFPPHQTKRVERAGYVHLTTSPEPEEGEKPADVVFRHAADCIRDLVQAAPHATVGVLVRTNNAVARMIYLLRHRGVAASEEGGNPLVDSPAVELLLSLLRLADHPGDRVAHFHLASSPLADACAEEIARRSEIKEFREDDCLAASMLGRQIRRQLLDDGYGATVYAWAQHLAPSCDERDLARLQQLVELAFDYQPTSTVRCDTFIRRVETKRIADPSSAAVRVMTIHQAKGLEFDAVFLPELGVPLTGQREMFVAGRPQPTEPVNLVCRLANDRVRQFFSPELQKLFEDDTRQEVVESLCVLYVAMTRAVHGLYMIIPPARSNERNLPKTYAGLLRATLAPANAAAASQTLYEQGTAQWHQSKTADTLKPAAPHADASREVLATIHLAPAAARRDRGLERTSPSSLEGGRRIRGVQVLAPSAQQSIRLGTLYHAWLQQIEWLDNGLPSEEQLERAAQRLRGEIGDVRSELKRLIKQFRKHMAAAPIAGVMSRSFYNVSVKESPQTRLWGGAEANKIRLSVHCERTFAVRRDNEILTGSIDRLVIVHEGSRVVGADVVDFKTDEFDAKDKEALHKRASFYRPQLEAYRAAVMQMLGLASEHVGARFVFVTAGAVCEIA